MTSKPDRPVAPFQNDAEYIQFALEGLVASRVERLYAEKALRDATRYRTPLTDQILCRKKPGPVTEAEEKLHAALENEALAVAEYEARLKVHYNTPGAIGLSLKRTVEAYGLDSREEMILLSLIAPCVSEGLAERTLGGLDLRYSSGNLSVDNILVLLDPKNVSESVEMRRYLHRDSKLNTHQLISVTFHSGLKTPGDFLEGRVDLSPLGFALLLGLSPKFMAGEREVVASVERETRV